MVQLSLLGLVACSTLASAQWWKEAQKGGQPQNVGNGAGWNNNQPRPNGGNNAPGWNAAPPANNNGGNWGAPAPSPSWNNAPSPTRAGQNCAVSIYVFTSQPAAYGGARTSTQVRTHLVQTAIVQQVYGPYQDIIIEERGGQRETITRTRTNEHPVTYQTVVESVKTRTIIEAGGPPPAPVVATSTVTNCR